MLSDIIRRNNPLERYPTLREVLMVGKYVKAHEAENNKEELTKKLMTIISGEKIAIILDYLILSKKVSVDNKGMIGWIYYPVPSFVDVRKKR